MAAITNRYPLWKYILIVIVIAAAFIYAAPNLYPQYPAVQIMGDKATVVDDQVFANTKTALQNANLSYRDAQFSDQRILFRFDSTDVQFKAKEVIQQTLGENYLVALNLANATPSWLKSLGASPMKLGLDLRGGVHFLLQVDVDSVMQQRIEGDLRGIGQSLREEQLRQRIDLIVRGNRRLRRISWVGCAQVLFALNRKIQFVSGAHIDGRGEQI